LADSPLRVLFLGNSYTYVNDLPGRVQQLADARGELRPLAPRMIAAGGATLQDHWHNQQVHHALQHEPWDYVVLQEQSLRPLDQPDMMHHYAQQLHQSIIAGGAASIVYLTWARRDQPELQAGLSAAYRQCAARLGAIVAPVGPAWQIVARERPDLALYEADGSHPAPIGSYLAACLFYTILYQQSPIGLSPRLFSSQFDTPREGAIVELAPLDQADAAYLQRAAWTTVTEWT
jgi:hypothetical protein